MKNKRTVILASWFALFCYVFLVIYLVFYADFLGRSVSLTNTAYSYNLYPLKEIKRFIYYLNDPVYGKMAFTNLVGNVVLFMPLGFLLPTTLKKLGFLGVLLISLASSFAIEAVQLFTKLGAFDVDDIILNLLGALLGFILFLIIKPGK